MFRIIGIKKAFFLGATRREREKLKSQIYLSSDAFVDAMHYKMVGGRRLIKWNPQDTTAARIYAESFNLHELSQTHRVRQASCIRHG